MRGKIALFGLMVAARLIAIGHPTRIGFEDFRAEARHRLEIDSKHRVFPIFIPVSRHFQCSLRRLAATGEVRINELGLARLQVIAWLPGKVEEQREIISQEFRQVGGRRFRVDRPRKFWTECAEADAVAEIWVKARLTARQGARIALQEISWRPLRHSLVCRPCVANDDLRW